MSLQSHDQQEFRNGHVTPCITHSHKHACTHMYSRLRCVQWVCAVANVLSAVKHTERQTCQEVSGRQVSCHGTHSEAGALWKTHTHTGTNHRAGSGWPSHIELHTRSLTHIHTFQKDRDVLQLRDVVLSVTTVFDQQGEIFQILPAGVTGIQFAQFSEDYAPRAHFLCCVFNTWDGVSTGGTERNGTQALTDRKL